MSFKQTLRSIVLAGTIMAAGTIGLTSCIQNETQYKPITMSESQNYNLQELEKIILHEAVINQTLIFGENHSTNKDDQYLISLLPKLKKLGYKDIGLEIDYSLQVLMDLFAKEDFGSSLFYALLKKNYRSADHIMEVIKASKELGLRIHFYDDVFQKPVEMGTYRNSRMYENLKKQIFDKRPKAKVIIFTGGWHANEEPIIAYHCGGTTQVPLGYFLNIYTHGKNYSVLLGTVNKEIEELFILTKMDLSLVHVLQE